VARQPPVVLEWGRIWANYRGGFPYGQGKPVVFATLRTGDPDAACARSSTDRASDYGSEGWGFESLRAHSVETDDLGP
jgi:hypothetical protein